MKIRVESEPERISKLRHPLLANEDIIATRDGVFGRGGGGDAIFRPSDGEVRKAAFNQAVPGEILLVVSVPKV